MAVMGVATNVKRCMEVYYLNEDIWADRNGNDFVHLFIVFKAMRKFNTFFLFFHGKPTNPRLFSLFEKRFPVKKKNGENVVVLTDLTRNPLYLEKEIWEKGAELLGGNYARIEHIKKVNLLNDDSIKLEWERKFNECSVLKICYSGEFQQGKFYGLRIGVLFRPPAPTRFGLKSTVKYGIHYCTFRGIDPADRQKIATRWRNENFAPIYLKMPMGELGTSTLMIYVPPEYKLISPPITSPMLERDFMPMSVEPLSPSWKRYRWSDKEFAQAKFEPKLTAAPDREERAPLDLVFERFDLNKIRDYSIGFITMFLAVWALTKNIVLGLLISIIILLVGSAIIERVIGKPAKLR